MLKDVQSRLEGSKDLSADEIFKLKPKDLDKVLVEMKNKEYEILKAAIKEKAAQVSPKPTDKEEEYKEDNSASQKHMKKELDQFDKFVKQEIKKRAKLQPVNDKIMPVPFSNTNWDAQFYKTNLMKELVPKIGEVKNIKDLKGV
eukprot:CAMPEP_0116912978 /NCGR_PEP_ID=MMETSP0467-20121206/16422_1 /TAXON_ID=283647 /ORGANISM="Mesodinium pulex, Strain SPMC105" /LENGTH=143 /DNA_ID=CAMNT_0004589089 /DNA_START=474 /DNA_END=905 /DNA_ORIENTATION=+